MGLTPTLKTRTNVDFPPMNFLIAFKDHDARSFRAVTVVIEIPNPRYGVYI